MDIGKKGSVLLKSGPDRIESIRKEFFDRAGEREERSPCGICEIDLLIVVDILEIREEIDQSSLSSRGRVLYV